MIHLSLKTFYQTNSFFRELKKLGLFYSRIETHNVYWNTYTFSINVWENVNPKQILCKSKLIDRNPFHALRQKVPPDLAVLPDDANVTADIAILLKWTGHCPICVIYVLQAQLKNSSWHLPSP